MSKKGPNLEKIILRDNEILKMASSRFDDETKELLRYQTGAGRGREGHGGGFRGKKFPNLTSEKYCNIVKNDKTAFLEYRKERQIKINAIRNWLNLSIQYLGNLKQGIGFEAIRDQIDSFSYMGEALCGIPLLGLRRVYSHETVIRAYASGGDIDSEGLRKIENKREQSFFKQYLKSHPQIPFDLKERLQWSLAHPFRRGVTQAVNLNALKRLNEELKNKGSDKLSLVKIANCDRKTKIKLIEKIGGFGNEGKTNPIHFIDALTSEGVLQGYSNNYVDPNIVSGYVELTPGVGISDGWAYLFSAFIYGTNLSNALDAATGFQLPDFTDTFDKDSMEISDEGQDGAIGNHLKKEYMKRVGKPLLNPLKCLAHLYASKRVPRLNATSCSQSKLWGTSHGSTELGVSAIELLDEFIQRTFNGDLANYNPKNIPMDFQSVPIINVLQGFITRYNEIREECKATGIFPVEFFPDRFSQELPNCLKETKQYVIANRRRNNHR